MARRLDLAVTKGCDAVEPDYVEVRMFSVMSVTVWNQIT